MLTRDEAYQMERWIVVARNWGQSSLGWVWTSTDFSTACRELADQLEAGSGPPPDRSKREDLAQELRHLADVIEAQVQIVRDDYLATAASLDVLESTM
jgi:hypothetical protein